MIGYAVKKDRSALRAILSIDEISHDEYYSDVVVEITCPETYAQELSALNTAYITDRLELCQVWLVAAVADGVNENTRKEDIEAEIAELDNQHNIDVAELKTKYGVS